MAFKDFFNYRRRKDADKAPSATPEEKKITAGGQVTGPRQPQPFFRRSPGRQGFKMVVDTLYGEGTPRNRAELPFSLDSAMESALKSLYRSHSEPSDFVPEELFSGIAKTLDSAVSDGFRKEYPELTELMHENNEVFAAFKVHDQCSRMAELLTGEDGSLLDFEEWRKIAEPIATHHNRVWLRTEYDTAVRRAAQAREWMQFRDEKDVLPNLRWVPSTAANPGADHMVFWDTVRPVDDPFWSQHKPGDRWGCQCSLEATDDPETPIPETVFQDPDAGLDNNPADDGRLFSDSHPYYPSSCSTCPFNTGGTNTSGPTNKADKHCTTCQYLQPMLEKERTSKLTHSDESRISRDVRAWADDNLPMVTLPDGQPTKRLSIKCGGDDLIVNKAFFKETFAKNVRHSRLAETMNLATEIEDWLPEAKFIRTEEGRHHNCDFLVYEAKYEGTSIEIKVKDQSEKIVYTMRIKK